MSSRRRDCNGDGMGMGMEMEMEGMEIGDGDSWNEACGMPTHANHAPNMDHDSKCTNTAQNEFEAILCVCMCGCVIRRLDLCVCTSSLHRVS